MCVQANTQKVRVCTCLCVSVRVCACLCVSVRVSVCFVRAARHRSGAVVRRAGVHAGSLDSQTERKAASPSSPSAPSLLPSNIYTHTLLEPLKYN